MWIPKKEESKTIDQFRTISLLSIKENIFFSIVAKCLTDCGIRTYIPWSRKEGSERCWSV